MTALQEHQLAPSELSYADLFHPCDASQLGFQSTDELPDLQHVIGQPRAVRALEFGSEVSGPGYNIFVLGLPGSGRTTLSLEHLRRKAESEPAPDDWCYVNNFENPRAPRALRLHNGGGGALRKDMQDLVDFCEREMARAFQSEEYTRERDRLFEELKQKHEAEFIRLQKYVDKYQFAITRTPFGFLLVPALQGKPLKQEEIDTLPEDQRAKLEQLRSKLSEEVDKTIEKMRILARETFEQFQNLNQRTAQFLIVPSMESLRDKYISQEGVLSYLDAVEADIIANVDHFIPSNSSEQRSAARREEFTLRYSVNVLVDHSESQGAPVILESHPAYYSLLGRIEHEVVMGVSRTDFTKIQPGVLHQANGGYLILPARDLLVNPYAWEGLKRVLRDGRIRIIELGSQLGLLSTETLEPEPIPLDLKIVLVGTPLLYYLLRIYDEDFSKLFKVRAEFASLMERTPQTEKEYGLFVRSVVDDNQLPPFESQAVARLIEYSSRLAEHKEKLSTRFGKIADLVREAAYWAKKTSKELNEKEHDKLIVRAQAVQRAIDESIYRDNLLDERIQELIQQDVLMIDVSGTAIGQINGLSVIFLGDYAFGRPNRITASVYPGQAGIVDIERQAKLGGPIHTKGVLIISGFLGGRYGCDQTLSLSASLTFEQSYEEVEGDSASAAELFALLSAIAAIPLRQDRAVTGSINQYGQVQAIGGVNQKIEGFFATCKAKGLTGEQGILIPRANLPNLMLREDVIEAVKSKQFHVWAFSNIDEGLELLTDQTAGVRQEDGSYPKGTFNYAVTTRLAEFAKIVEPKKDEKG